MKRTGQDEESDIFFWVIFHCHCCSFVLKGECEPKIHVSKKNGDFLNISTFPTSRPLVTCEAIGI